MSSSEPKQIAFRDVTVKYPGRTEHALTGVSLTAEPGRITAVAGPNGSGKSSLIRTLLGRVRRERGEILLSGQRAESFTPSGLARCVAVVPQREEPVMPLLVREFVALGRFPHRSAFGAMSANDLALVELGMQRAGIADCAERRTDTLSGGEWQRARVARAIAQDTGALVFDEPTTFLDMAHEMAVFELMDSLAREGRTVLLVSHQLNLVARFANHIVLLDHGSVAAAGSASDVMRGEILERVYHWPLVVTRDPAIGSPTLLPLRDARLAARQGSDGGSEPTAEQRRES